MRKNIIITALALMGAIAFTSCVREEFESPGEAQKDNTVNFTINTGSAEVKSYMEYDEEAGKYVPNWHKGDALAAYFVSADGAPTQAAFANTNENGPKASFSGSAALEAGNYDLYAVCPARSYQSVTETMVVGLEFPYIQFPTATSFDPKADVLVNVPYDVTVEGTDVTIDDMRFRRVGSIVKVVLSDKTGSLAGDNIRSVYLESDMEGAALSGVFNYDYKTEDAAGMTEPKNHVTADLTRLETPLALDGENAVYLVLPPCTLTAGSKLTVNVKTDRHEVVKTITLAKDIKFLSSEVITLSVGLDANCTVERVYFQDNFDWLYYWWDTIPSDDKDGIRDPLAEQNTEDQKQPNIWSKYAATVGADVTARGYVDIYPANNTLYMQENYFKMGANNKQTGLQLPAIEFGEEPVNVTLSFDWAVQHTRIGIVVEVLEEGVCYETLTPVSHQMKQASSLKWQTETITLYGVTNKTRIQIRPDLESYVTSGYYRWWLDNIKVAEVDKELVLTAATFPVVWSMPDPEELVMNEDYLVGDLDNGAYMYSDTHEGKMTVVRPANTACNPSTYGWRDNDGLTCGSFLHYGMNKDAYWLFEVYKVNNPAGTYNIKYKTIASGSGPKFFILEYSVDEGETWTAVNTTTESWNKADGTLYGDVTYTYVLAPESNEANETCNVDESFTIGAFNAYKTLMIRARVSSQLKESAAGEMAETSGGTNRIFDNIKISFIPDSE